MEYSMNLKEMKKWYFSEVASEHLDPSPKPYNETEVVIDPTTQIGNNVVFVVKEGEPIVIGANTLVRSGAVLYYGTKLGSKVSIGHNSVIRERTIIGNHSYVGSLTAIEGDIEIGSHVGIHTQVHITKYGKIEDYVFIAPLTVFANDNVMSYRREGHGTNLKMAYVKYGARIAVACTILPGVTIGRQAIIGAGSTVTKDIPDYTLAYGVPARVIKQLPTVDDIIKCKDC